MSAGFAVEDGVALHFRGTRLERVVSSRPDGRAFRVERRGARVREAALEVEYLGDAGRPAGLRTARASAGPRRARRRWRGRSMSARARHRRAASRPRSARSSRWAAAASRWSRPTRCSTTSCSRSPRAREPRILFLPTASGDTTPQINAFKARFHGRTCVAEHLLAVPAARDARGRCARSLAEQDILYVGGGSMRNLLAIWRAHELDALLIEAWERGTVLAGLSAGAMCWFQWGLTRSSGPPEPLEGLGLLDGSLTVHADGEPERLPVWLGAPARRHAAGRAGRSTTASACSSTAARSSAS